MSQSLVAVKDEVVRPVSELYNLVNVTFGGPQLQQLA